ncbi:terminase large subunit [Agrobacterium pusense]|uniref:terminase large subunit n=1 Tax=Agrobacterium pusense TaxID=648995 RepID=UPI00087EC629|nr:terminase large subunit [Agrobacterium pusense]MBW9058309.1 terminase large subunit [Agrobacterium pusense]WKD45588.1 terminase large subunit [Agrobacterium pusense]SDF27804.1 Phage terminase-like protein, large subunit, contains N-terminal HTH domain [Agrobacterium pusense]
MWDTSCQDWERRIVAGESLIPFDPLFPEEADAALDVFKSLKIVDAPGSPTFGKACEEWVFDFVKAIFGAYDHETAKRNIREFFLLISKKNSKSTIAAGIMLTALIRNWRHSAELLILAPTIEIANNSYGPAADMVRADPDLTDLLHIQDNFRTITHRVTGAKLKVVAADTDTVGGKKAAFVLVDELWIFGKRNNADAMLREATGGLVSRPEGFVIYLSTQSDAPPAGVFKAKLDYFRDVRDGKIADRKSLGVIYEFPKAMIEAESYLDPQNFYITNPNLGRSVSAEWIEEELVKEVAKDSETRNTFLAKHLNVEIGMNLRSNRWAGADFWADKADAGIDLESILERSEVVVVGIDGGGLDDLFGLTVLGRERGPRDWLSWSHAWCHKGVLERRKSIASKLNDFKRDGLLTIVDDELKDISEIVEIISDIKARGLLASVAVDPAGLGEMIEALAEIDVTQEAGNLVGAPQGYAMMNSIKTAERKLANGTLKHAPSALMDWCVSNLKIEPTATAIRATKQNAGDAKIDPVMSLFDAVTVMSRNPEAPGAGMDDYFKSLAGAA